MTGAVTATALLLLSVALPGAGQGLRMLQMRSEEARGTLENPRARRCGTGQCDSKDGVQGVWMYREQDWPHPMAETDVSTCQIPIAPREHLAAERRVYKNSRGTRAEAGMPSWHEQEIMQEMERSQATSTSGSTRWTPATTTMPATSTRW